MRQKVKSKMLAAKGVCCLALCVLMATACGTPAGNNSYLQESTVTPQDSVTITGGKHYSDYATEVQMWEAGKDLSVEIAEEGDVLLKNENNVLPFKSNVKRVSLFGMHSVSLIQSTTGSGAGTTNANGIPESTLPQAMEDAGFKVNTALTDLYNKQYAMGQLANELPESYYTNSVIGTYNGFNDAAIITLSRIGSEGRDLGANNVEGHSDENDHALMLDDNEIALVKHVKKYFDKVIVLINSSNIMQIPELAEPKTEDNLGVDAILWVGNTGNNAIEAVPAILKGEVNPSGHTVDLWAKDFRKGPTWSNFSANTQNKDENGNRMDSYLYYNGEDTGYRSVEYREGIYMGYRYYETVAADMDASDSGTGEQWYEDNVLFPFGYGLSYTTFEWELMDDIAPEGKIETANHTVTLKIRVTNTGSVAGKDVVQIYYTAPYTKGGIEKAEVNLVDFAKTELLAPGESQVLEIQFVAQDMASFDWNDANKNGFSGYELEAGDYKISARRNSHDEVLSVTRTVESNIQCKTDYLTGAEIKPVFVDKYTSVNEPLIENSISRANGLSQPKTSSKEDRTLTAEHKELLDSQETYRSYQDQTTDLWYVNNVPSGWTQSDGKDKPTLTIQDMTGLDMTAPRIENGEVVIAQDEGSQKWEQFMNQMTWEELIPLVESGGGVLADERMGITGTGYADGPVQFSKGTLWACAPITAATYNVELAERQGRMVGNEAYYKDTYFWAGPAMNIHRSPLSGRNQEYYSEDGVQGGMIASAVVRGATSMGLNCYIKHMFLNDQEGNRDVKGGVLTWATEQTIREIYAKPFEMALKQGGSTAIMSSFNRIGNVNSAQNYAMHYDLVRDEWGSDAIWVTDAWMGRYCPVDYMIRSGDPQVLGTPSKSPEVALEQGEWSAEQNCVLVDADAEGTTKFASPTHYAAVRIAAQKVLYIYANSGAIRNGFTGVENDAVMEFDIGCTVSRSLTLEGFEQYEVGNLSVAEGDSLPEGFTIQNGMITGKATEGLEEEVNLVTTIDGYIPLTIPVTIKGVSPIHDSGSDFSKLKVGQSAETLFDNSYYVYGEWNTELTTGTAFWAGARILNWYWLNEDDSESNPREKGAILDCEAQSTDTISCTPEQAANAYRKYEYSYSHEGTLPAGMKFEPTYTTRNGTMGGTYQVMNGYKLVGTPTQAGDFDVTIKLLVPLVNCWPNGSFPNNVSQGLPSYIEVVRTITIHVDA